MHSFLLYVTGIVEGESKEIMKSMIAADISILMAGVRAREHEYSLQPFTKCGSRNTEEFLAINHDNYNPR